MTRATIFAALATLGAATMLAGIAGAAEIKALASPGIREPYTLLVPGFEKAWVVFKVTRVPDAFKWLNGSTTGKLPAPSKSHSAATTRPVCGGTSITAEKVTGWPTAEGFRLVVSCVLDPTNGPTRWVRGAEEVDTNVASPL